MRASARRGPFRPRTGGFVLLEVVVAMVILGISVATLMRSFSLSMNAIRKNEVTTTACVLAEGMLQKLEVEPPAQKTDRGTFEEMGYKYYSWEMEYEEEEIDYKHLKVKNKPDNLRPLRHVKLRVTYDNRQQKAFTPVQLDLYLPPIERYSYQCKMLNQLFLEEEQ